MKLKIARLDKAQIIFNLKNKLGALHFTRGGKLHDKCTLFYTSG